MIPNEVTTGDKGEDIVIKAKEQQYFNMNNKWWTLGVTEWWEGGLVNLYKGI